MQVSSQTCSCTEKDRPGKAGGLWNKPRISSSPSASFLICSHSQLRSTQTQHCQTQPSFPGISPPTTERWVCPPIYTSVWSPTHIKQQQQPRAHLIGQLSEWSELLITSEAADSSFSDSCSSHIGAHIRTVHKSANTSHMQISENCPCPYIPTGANLHFPISPSGR